jgi:hypothetical protein
MANGPWNFPMLRRSIISSSRWPIPATETGDKSGGDQLFIGKTPTPEQEACAFAFGEWIRRMSSRSLSEAIGQPASH